ncbi:TPA: hypothetical protein N0F65_003386 [Lagenidium giganteum]|uniref:ABC transporter domain-containing protein n=1 Tax=Lagenidium giganteum TaxID=4803 RepID=A0AAV2YVD8_9STRA|nr:TPA: hypothetical protein N0F65_003386 [Lagenidium giganteum]
MKDSPYRSRGNTVTPGPGTILDDNVERERRRIAAQRGPLADPHRQDDVQLYNVSKLVPTASSPITALLSTSVGFYAGECFCVLGVKGSGKSTLLKILAGETLPTTGDVIVSGYHIVDELWEVRQRRIVGYCPQDDKCLDPLLRVREHFEMLAAMNNMGATDDARCTIVMQVVNTMGLTNCQNCLIGSLSQCEQRLVSIGSAIMGLPPVVLLDEPTARVDAASRERIWRILRTLCIDQRACTLIVATQNLDECEALSSRVGVVVDGMLQSFDVFEELARMGDFGWVLDVQTAEPTDAKIDELARGYFDDSEQFLTSATLTGKCEAMGNSFWVNNISSTHPTGQWLALALARDGFLSRTVFCTWWLSELRHEAFLQSLENAFGRDYMRLLFREHARCRFQLILEESDLRLSQVFKMLEKAKCQNNISQYFLQRSTLQEVLATHAMTAHPTRSWYR